MDDRDHLLHLCDFELRRMCKEISDYMKDTKEQHGIDPHRTWLLVSTLLEDMSTLHTAILGKEETHDADMDK